MNNWANHLNPDSYAIKEKGANGPSHALFFFEKS